MSLQQIKERMKIILPVLVALLTIVACCHAAPSTDLSDVDTLLTSLNDAQLQSLLAQDMEDDTDEDEDDDNDLAALEALMQTDDADVQWGWPRKIIKKARKFVKKRAGRFLKKKAFPLLRKFGKKAVPFLKKGAKIYFKGNPLASHLIDQIPNPKLRAAMVQSAEEAEDTANLEALLSKLD